MSLNVEVKINYDNDELFCLECKNRINLNEKYLVIVEQMYDGEVIKTPVHLDCIEKTYEDEQEDYFINPT
jgi:hypothetical protein